MYIYTYTYIIPKPKTNLTPPPLIPPVLTELVNALPASLADASFRALVDSLLRYPRVKG